MRALVLALLLVLPGCEQNRVLNAVEAFDRGYTMGVTDGYNLAVSDMAEKLSTRCFSVGNMVYCAFAEFTDGKPEAQGE